MTEHNLVFIKFSFFGVNVHALFASVRDAGVSGKALRRLFLQHLLGVLFDVKEEDDHHHHRGDHHRNPTQDRVDGGDCPGGLHGQRCVKPVARERQRDKLRCPRDGKLACQVFFEERYL